MIVSNTKEYIVDDPIEIDEPVGILYLEFDNLDVIDSIHLTVSKDRLSISMYWKYGNSSNGRQTPYHLTLKDTVPSCIATCAGGCLVLSHTQVCLTVGHSPKISESHMKPDFSWS